MILSMFSYQFMVYAFIVGISVSICAALLGVVLVLKKQSMIGDGLSHVGFGAAAIALSLGWAPLAVMIPVVSIASIIILLVSKKSRIYGDSAIALIASSSLAIGYIIIHASGTSVDIESFLYGSIFGITNAEMVISIILCVVVVLLYVLTYNKIFSITFDSDFASSTGTKASLYSVLIAILASLTIVVGMKVMGALLISSLILFPTLSARQICKTFKGVVITGVLISVISFTVGLVINYYVDTPVGSMIVVVNLCVLLVLVAIRKLLKK